MAALRKSVCALLLTLGILFVVDLVSGAERTDEECVEAAEYAQNYVSQNSEMLKQLEFPYSWNNSREKKARIKTVLMFSHSWNWGIVYYLAPVNGGNVLPECVTQGKTSSEVLKETRRIWCETRTVFTAEYPATQESDLRVREVMGCQ